MPQNDAVAPGTVWLVGAGPGDPDLLTRKAERLLAAADIVFHDALVGPAILSLLRADCDIVSVGKRSGRHSRDQSSINAMIVAAAKSGKRVVRLKGGDPSIFGRSAEEIAHCDSHDIPVAICPGITAASAAAASAGTSLTLRGVARGLTLITAHARKGEVLDIDWSALTSGRSTLAIYMGRSEARMISRQLIEHGLDPSTPVLIGVNVSLSSERMMRGKLSALDFLVQTISDSDPTLLLIGDALGNAEVACTDSDVARKSASGEIANRYLSMKVR